MNIYVSIALFILIVMLYMVISELFTILFRFTGLPDEKARFQVLSLLTGCGFTTRESEMVLSTKSRRRLARIMMLFGYVFNITIVSALVNLFFSLHKWQIERYSLIFLVPLTALAALLILSRLPAVRGRINTRLERLAERVIVKGSANSVMILDYIGQDSIALVSLRTIPEELEGKTLSEMGLRAKENILVMLLERGNSKAVPAGPETSFLSGDKLTVFGSYKSICRVFEVSEAFDIR